MKYILCYGDSNTWGCTPEVFERYDFNVRWPGVMQNLLGNKYHIYENALNGRTTVFEDYIEEGRCGKIGLPVVLEANAPLDLVIIMLGTNDVKLRFKMDAWDIGWGIDLLIQYVKKAGCGRDGGIPKILIASPVILGTCWAQTILGTVFDNSCTEKSKELANIYSTICQRNECDFLDASLYASVSKDCVHLEPEEHKKLGEAFTEKVIEILR